MAEETTSKNQVVCPYCKRLITLPEVVIGSTEKCPHCDIEFVVSSRLMPKAPDKGEEDVSGGYGLQTAVEEKKPRDAPIFRIKARGEEESGEEEADGDTWRPMATPPLSLFYKSTFLFPFTAGPRAWMIFIFIFCIAEFAAILFYAGYSSTGAILDLDVWIISMILPIYIVIIGLVGIVLTSAVMLTVLLETSEGVDKFEKQKIGWFTDWFGHAMYMIFNLFIGAGPALILFLALDAKPAVKAAVYLLSEIILFPVLLISALECRSPVTPISKPVWKSLWRAWHAWALFYLLTLLIGITFLYLLQVVPFEYLSHVSPFKYLIYSLGSTVFEAAFISLLLPFLLIVYFRLLGRLAWFCSGRYDMQLKSGMRN